MHVRNNDYIIVKDRIGRVLFVPLKSGIRDCCGIIYKVDIQKLLHPLSTTKKYKR